LTLAEIPLSFLKKILPRRLLSCLRPPYHFFLAFLAALFYGFPSRQLKVIGVTGTKGKTTVVEILHEILSSGGSKVASLSSLYFRLGAQDARNLKKMTMPGRFFLQKFLHQALRAGCKYAVVEVTSEGIKQFRHRFLRFEVAVITNVAPEHIEAHGSFEKYLRAKLDLFWRLPKEGIAVINRDSPYGQRFSAATSARHKVFYSRDKIDTGMAQYAIEDLRLEEKGIAFELIGLRDNAFSSKSITFSSPLCGEFNFYNILAAVSVGLALHISPKEIASALSKIAIIPGRMEFIQQEPFTVVVDYAHTPDSLKSVYSFLRENSIPAPQRPKGFMAGTKPLPSSEAYQRRKNSKFICVLGAAGGGRDKWKRPEFGKIAAEFCEEVILTSEDPYDEDPRKIIEDIAAGFESADLANFRMIRSRKILDRREAIREALKSAAPGDVLIITGKGAEPWMMVSDGKKIPWDDRAVVKEEMEKLRKTGSI